MTVRRKSVLIEDHEAVVSAASIWEIAIKVSIGRLDADPAAVRQALEPSGFDELPVTANTRPGWPSFRRTTATRSIACSSRSALEPVSKQSRQQLFAYRLLWRAHRINL
jgi:PIN domain nuclease of toxin-antitoxin system